MIESRVKLQNIDLLRPLSESHLSYLYQLQQVSGRCDWRIVWGYKVNIDKYYDYYDLSSGSQSSPV